MNDSILNIRPATPHDIPTILTFIRELAEYEREPDAVRATEADLLRDGWGTPARFTAIIADYNGAPAGFALYFTTYSTWRGHHGIRLEDLYVTPSLRGHGIGKALLARLARIAVDQGCPRLEWDVLDVERACHRRLPSRRRPHPHRVAHHAPRRRAPRRTRSHRHRHSTYPNSR